MQKLLETGIVVFPLDDVLYLQTEPIKENEALATNIAGLNYLFGLQLTLNEPESHEFALKQL